MRVLGWLLHIYLRLVWLTARMEISGNTALRTRALNGQVSLVYSIWHGRLLGATYDPYCGLAITAIASRSGDGEFAAQFLEPFGIKMIRGSSSNPKKPSKQKGGAAAMAAALRFLRETPDGIIAMTPDGPKGPRGVCHFGVAAIAMRAGVPVLPLAWSSSRALTFNSWDRAMVPLPFTRIHVVWGDELAPPTDYADRDVVERFRLDVENAMLAVTVAADRLAGRKDVYTQAVAEDA